MLVVGSSVWNSMYVDEPDDPLVIEVVGKQFEWFVHYPGKDGVLSRTVPPTPRDRVATTGSG